MKLTTRISHFALFLCLPKELDMNKAYMLTCQSCKQVSEAHISINETRDHNSVRGEANQAGAARSDPAPTDRYPRLGGSTSSRTLLPVVTTTEVNEKRYNVVKDRPSLVKPKIGTSVTLTPLALPERKTCNRISNNHAQLRTKRLPTRQLY